MAKAGIKIQAISGGPDGVIVINAKESGDALFLEKGYEATYTFAQGGTLVQGDFIKVKIKRYPMGGYYAGGNLVKITCFEVEAIDDKIATLTGRKGTIVVKNPDAIVENAPPGGTSGNHAGNILSNGAVKGDFITFELVNGNVVVTGILTNCSVPPQ